MKNKKWLKQKVGQSLTMILVLLLICPINLAANKKKGAQVKVEKNAGGFVEGELLSVRADSLVIMMAGSLTGVTIGIDEISKIRIKKKAKFGKGALKGAIIAVGLTVVLAGLSAASDDNSSNSNSYSYNSSTNINLSGMDVSGMVVMGVIAIGAIGAGIGGLIGIAGRDYKTVKVEGKSESEVKKIMKKLNKKARFKN